MFPVQREGVWGFINNIGKITIELKFNEAQNFSEGIAGVLTDEGWGFIDESGRYLYLPQFNGAEPFFEQVARVRLEDCWGFVDLVGNVYSLPSEYIEVGRAFSQGLVLIGTSEEKYGYINKLVEEVIQPQYDYGDPFSENLAAVHIGGWPGGRWGFIDFSGQLVIKPSFDKVLEGFRQSLARVSYRDEVIYIDRTGSRVDDIKAVCSRNSSEGLATISVRNRWGYASIHGDVVIEPIFESAYPFCEGLAAVQVTNRKWGYINKMGETVIDPKFDHASCFSHGLALVDVGNSEGYIDKRGIYVWKSFV
ncbi:glr2303 [Gloeobacter violaceus PCC 7421]|uniref:Glr2303 protein n=1 Tax=Gloeobacter violaceus (strain ATCC 29082 / PCC 7421) TaxID=251221 RepID=Q7NI80_GLOVI|nr:glr2303 [Gloeobacter violaceus PCC 7421]